jgi:hypothetical protein
MQALQSGERAPVEPRRPLGANGGAGGNLQRACSWLAGVPPPAKPVVKRLLLVRARSRFPVSRSKCALFPPTACLPIVKRHGNFDGMDQKYTMPTVEIPAEVEPSGDCITPIGTPVGAASHSGRTTVTCTEALSVHTQGEEEAEREEEVGERSSSFGAALSDETAAGSDVPPRKRYRSVRVRFALSHGGYTIRRLARAVTAHSSDSDAEDVSV